jgi:hypothetical protein
MNKPIISKMNKSVIKLLPTKKSREPGIVAHTIILVLGRLRQEDHKFEDSLACAAY